MSQLRQDPVTHDWVIINPDRAKRPEDTGAAETLCPFCPGNEHLTPEPVDCIEDEGHWTVRVVPNRFPALTASLQAPASVESLPGSWRHLPGYGYHEVIIESPHHRLSTGTLPESQVVKVIDAYLRRYRALSTREGVRQIVLFRNHGRRAGTSLAHPHSQIVATPVVAPETRWRLSEEIEFFDSTGKCGICHVLDEELVSAARIVYATRHFATLVPYAARVPYHIQIIPRRHSPTFLEVDPAECGELARHLSHGLGTLFNLLHDPDYNLVVVTPPLDQVHRLANHWFIDVLPRLTIPAGFELGSRIIVNIQTPERAAEELRALENAVGNDRGGAR
jgi:UDPglucose--hexose-1-phosphate uridylyltransferase